MFNPDIEDVFLWSDGTWCYRCELQEMQHMSDDFEVLLFDSPEYLVFMEKFN